MVNIKESTFKLLCSDEFDEIMELFNKDFFFMTSYPELVSEYELKSFLLSAKTYKIIDEGSLIGLALFKSFNPEYVFFRYKVKKEFMNTEKNADMFKKFIGIIKSEHQYVSRLETQVYEFDTSEINFYEKLVIPWEIVKKNEVFKYDRLWKVYLYSLVGNEIKEFLKEG